MIQTARNLLGVCLVALAAASCLATVGDATGGPAAAWVPAQLAADVSATVRSLSIADDEKSRRIATAVGAAVGSAMSSEDRDSGLAAAQELVRAAAAAAPDFADAIADAALSVPGLAGNTFVAPKIRMAAVSGAMAGTGGSEPREPRPAPVRAATPARIEPAAPAIASSPAVTVTPVSGRSAAVTVSEPAMSGSALSLSLDGAPKDETRRFTFSATTGARFDDNIYLTPDDESDATVLTLAPGVSFDFGRRSAMRGSVSYQHAFVRYEGEPLPDANLGSGDASLFYDNGKLTVTGAASYEQINENTSATAGLGQQLFQRDRFDIALRAETPLTPKIRVHGGAEFNELKYDTPGLVGTRDFSLPFRLSYETTPKTRAGLGVTYRRIDPQGAGPRGRDLYYNVSASGDFTAKLSGDVSAGFRTRDVSGNEIDDIWGFDGTLRYAASLKTDVSLRLSRDFGAGALGESLISDRFSLAISADPTLQWSFRALLSYANSDYGPAVFAGLPVSSGRSDEFWAATFSAAYIVNAWFSAVADFTHRTADSTIPSANYGNNQINFSLGFRY